MKSQGVPEAALVQDAEGTRTRESIDRLKNYYKINRVIVVTSKSHIVRALYLCDGFGVESIGVVPAVEDVSFLQKLYALVYEYFAIHRAFIEQALTLEYLIRAIQRRNWSNERPGVSKGLPNALP
jgi:vancomycin permeability regulator SanA